MLAREHPLGGTVEIDDFCSADGQRNEPTNRCELNETTPVAAEQFGQKRLGTGCHGHDRQDVNELAITIVQWRVFRRLYANIKHSW